MTERSTSPLASARVRFDRGDLERLCRSHGVRRLALFGSTLHGNATPESDIDLLVEFDEQKIPGLFRIVRIESELSALLGRRVDLRTPEDLSRYFRQEVVAESEPIYEAD